jgi:hypothetical protein
MEKYLIQYATKVNGEYVVLYHESIILNTIKDSTNAYVESLTTDIKLARVFYEWEEAVKVAQLFDSLQYDKTIIKKI